MIDARAGRGGGHGPTGTVTGGSTVTQPGLSHRDSDSAAESESALGRCVRPATEKVMLRVSSKSISIYSNGFNGTQIKAMQIVWNVL